MDRKKSSSRVISDTYIPHAQLWVGPHDILLQEVYRYLQTILCNQGGCSMCTVCTHIVQQQHHAICWLYPEKQYTLDKLEIIFSTLAFALDPDALFFFIIQKADTLSAACSNQLLKSLEEPPRGYHFLLLTDNTHDILPTIRSRCIIKTWHTQSNEHAHQAIIDCFTKKNKLSATAFALLVETSKINEHETKEVIELLLTYWGQQYKKALLKNTADATQRALYMVEHFKHALIMAPMPGSSKLFWKNLFLQVHG
jgi:hypothetical protein